MVPLTAIALLSIGLFSVMDALLGYLTNVLGISVYESIFIRTSLVFLLSLGYVIHTGTPDAPFGPPVVRHFMWTRGVLISIGLITGYSSLRYLTISEFLTIYCCLPFPTGLLCWILSGERFTKIQAICCCFAVLGVAMITDPFTRFSQDPIHHETPIPPRAIDDNIPNDLISKLIGLAICLPSMLALAGEMTVMRFIKDQASTIQILVIISFCPAVISAFIMTITRIPIVYPETPLGWIMLFSIVPCGLGAQYTLTYASSRLPGVHVTICSYAGIIFSTTIQWLVYGNHLSPFAFFGMFVICVSGLCAVLYGPTKEDGDQEAVTGEEHEVEIPLLDRDGRSQADRVNAV